MFEEFRREIEEYREEKIDPVFVRHCLMKVYGWIPEKEFYGECSIGEVLNLLKYIKKDAEREEREMKKIKRMK